MFYLKKFCRICIRSSGPLIDIDSPDTDKIKISDKLQYICAKMVISNEEHRQLMCHDCIQKLRVSYLFQKQCTKADQILEQYLSEITRISPEAIEPLQELGSDVDEFNIMSSSHGTVGAVTSFYNNSSISTASKVKVSTITTTITNSKPVRLRRQLKQEASFRISEAYKDRIRRLRRVCPRITKQQRCSLLRSLLTQTDHNCNSPVPVKKSRKYMLYHSRKRNEEPPKLNKSTLTEPKVVKLKGGLRDLLGFIKCYDFGYNVEDGDIKEECDSTVLDRLESFSRTFFYNDFQAYRETILSLASDSESSDEDDMFGPYNEEEDRLLWPECHSDGNCNAPIKKEDCDEALERSATDESLLYSDVQVKEESGPRVDYEHDVDLLPSAFVQACYEEQPADERPAMSHCLKQKINQGFQHFMNKIRTNLSSQTELSDPAAIVNHINRISVIPEASTSANLSNLDLLTRLTNSARLTKDATPKASAPPPTRCQLKCRTRGNPFINPQLMQQFQTRTFKCDTCNRSFKSPGYLHSHCTKMGH